MIEHNMNRVRMLDFPEFGDERGHLVIAEGMKDVPFEIKRVFIFMDQIGCCGAGQHCQIDNRSLC